MKEQLIEVSLSTMKEDSDKKKILQIWIQYCYWL